MKEYILELTNSVKIFFYFRNMEILEVQLARYDKLKKMKEGGNNPTVPFRGGDLGSA